MITPDNLLKQPLRHFFDSVDGAWRPVTDAFFQSLQGQKLADYVDAQVSRREVVYPSDPLKALALTPLKKVCVVILGQDPYHGAGQAQGLAFSVSEGVKIPPSLRNIYRELQRDLGGNIPSYGSLMHWAEQGVLLLNATLTVESGRPASHAKKGWEILTDSLIRAVVRRDQPVVFLLWGAHAQAKRELIQTTGQQNNAVHLILQSNHPSPLSATKPPVPFIGCGHFSQTNTFLLKHGQKPIQWMPSESI